MKTKVSIEKVIQIRTEYKTLGGYVLGTNKRFLQARSAAEHWANSRINDWLEIKRKKGISVTYGQQLKHEKELARRALPIFRRMLK